MALKIIGLAGSVRSGKTTVAHYLESRYQARVFRNSGILSDILDRLHVKHSRRSYAALGEALFSAFGFAVLARANLAEIQMLNLQSALVVIDGLRFPEEIELYGKEDFRLIFLCSKDVNRLDRAIKAQEWHKHDDRNLSLESLQALDKSVSESRLIDLWRVSDACIDNNGSLEQLFLSVDAILLKLGVVH